jgi:hypothetical protein
MQTLGTVYTHSFIRYPRFYTRHEHEFYDDIRHGHVNDGADDLPLLPLPPSVALNMSDGRGDLGLRGLGGAVSIGGRFYGEFVLGFSYVCSGIYTTHSLQALLLCHDLMSGSHVFFFSSYFFDLFILPLLAHSTCVR